MPGVEEGDQGYKGLRANQYQRESFAATLLGYGADYPDYTEPSRGQYEEYYRYDQVAYTISVVPAGANNRIKAVSDPQKTKGNELYQGSDSGLVGQLHAPNITR